MPTPLTIMSTSPALSSCRNRKGQRSMEKHQQQFSLWYFLIAFVLLVLLQSLFMGSHVETLDYSEFKALLRAGNIARVTLGTPYLRGELRTEGIEKLLPKDKVARTVKTKGKEAKSGLPAFAAVRVDA